MKHCDNTAAALPFSGAFLLLAALIGVAGCQGGTSVTVDIRVPQPLVDPIDARMGVYFDDTLKTYIHEEELDDHGSYRIDIGASQAPVFSQVLDAMFDSVVPVARQTPVQDEPAPAATPAPKPVAATFRSADGLAPNVDGILVPNIEEVQFAIPDQTGGEFYEVWIRYRMQLFDADGTPLSEWPLIGYGKANQRNHGTMDRKEAGLNEATIWALRDAAALLSFQFRNRTEVKDWLAAVEGETP